MSGREVRCRECRFCHALPLATPDPHGSLGLPPGRVYECRRLAPAFHPDRLYADWPCVKPEEDWCGEFQATPLPRRKLWGDGDGQLGRPGTLAGAPVSYWCPKCAGIHHPDVPCFDGGF